MAWDSMHSVIIAEMLKELGGTFDLPVDALTDPDKNVLVETTYLPEQRVHRIRLIPFKQGAPI